AAFVRAMEAHTLSGLVDGNRVDLLVNGDEIFPAMLAAIRQARTTITFANFVYEDGDIAGEMAAALAQRCRAGVGVNVLVDAVGGSPKPAFDQSWRHSTGLLLAGDAYFPRAEKRGDLAVQSVKSSPASGAAEAYVLFQLAIESARKSIYLTNPYFVPDGAIVDASVPAAERCVELVIITARSVSGTLDRLVRKATQAQFAMPPPLGVR